MVCAAVVGVRMYVLLLHRCIASSRCRYLSISVSEDTHGMTSSTSTPGLRPLTLLLHTTHVHAYYHQWCMLLW